MPTPSSQDLPALAQDLDMTRVPQHVAAIMDGNGRWATQRGLSRSLGHAQGYEALKGIVNICGELGVKYLTVYSFSTENWRRSAEEVSGLMSLIEFAAREQIENLHRKNVRFNIIGRMGDLPQSLQDELRRDMELTCNNTGLTFSLAINYGARTEIVDAVRRIVASGIAPEEVDEETISRNLYTADLPDPDLLIRTAGELRVSNYLLWQIAYSEIYVTDRLWPEFSEEDFVRALLAYQNRTRKFGAVVS